jgi:hypothetical protein
MDNTRLIERRRTYDTELAAGRYSCAEQICWQALEICGYGGPRRQFSCWLSSAGSKAGLGPEAVWLREWAGLLADVYYELGRYAEAEPVYAWLAVAWMSLPRELKGYASGTPALLPDLLRKLAGTEAFVGKEQRAGKHWMMAKRLAGKRAVVSAPDRSGTILAKVASLPRSRAGLADTLRGRLGHGFSRWPSVSRHRRFRRS